MMACGPIDWLRRSTCCASIGIYFLDVCNLSDDDETAKRILVDCGLQARAMYAILQSAGEKWMKSDTRISAETGK